MFSTFSPPNTKSAACAPSSPNTTPMPSSSPRTAQSSTAITRRKSDPMRSQKAISAGAFSFTNRPRRVTIAPSFETAHKEPFMNIYIIRHAEPDHAQRFSDRKGLARGGACSAAAFQKSLTRRITPPPSEERAPPRASPCRPSERKVEVCPWLREFDTGYKTRPNFHPTGHGLGLSSPRTLSASPCTMTPKTG